MTGPSKAAIRQDALQQAAHVGAMPRSCVSVRRANRAASRHTFRKSDPQRSAARDAALTCPVCATTTRTRFAPRFIHFGSIGYLGLPVAALAPDHAHAERADLKPDPDTICDTAAAQAAHRAGVPLVVLQAITRSETRRRRNDALPPWPWTDSMEGEGVWLASEAEARTYVFRRHQHGARSYDVGCFQLSCHWLGQAIASIEEIFDPLANARYAPHFLAELLGETGDLSSVTGTYDSRTKKYFDRYRAHFDQIVARLTGAPPPTPGPAEVVRVNSFQLTQTEAVNAG